MSSEKDWGVKGGKTGRFASENAAGLFVFLRHSNRQVILPSAVEVGPEPESGPLVSFLDAQGNVVAMFLRADVALYSHRNLGQALEQIEDPNKTGQTC